MDPRVVMVRRRTEYESLIREHGTAQMAAFRLNQRSLNLQTVADRHHLITDAARFALGCVPTTWRKTWVLREDLDRFRFDPEDIVVGVGMDGLVPNVAKYLAGQRVIGVNPFDFPQRMMHFKAKDLPSLYRSKQLRIQRRTMVEAALDDGRTITALNELFCGHRSHQSAKYDLQFADQSEYQSSSGIIITTGTGATGWASSIAAATGLDPTALPKPAEPWLLFMVREVWPSPFTGSTLIQGRVPRDGSVHLKVTSKMQDGGLLFGDGIESDHLSFSWGQSVVFRVSEATLNLVVPRKKKARAATKRSTLTASRAAPRPRG